MRYMNFCGVDRTSGLGMRHFHYRLNYTLTRNYFLVGLELKI